jgi:succinyl-diaminopimelate desuccinylase
MPAQSATIELCCDLMRRESVTPVDAGCQPLIAERLAPLGFEAHWLNQGEVTNLWLRRGHASPVFVFAGHTDVVPTGPVGQWTSPPFEPTFRDGYLYGRGAADMKGSLAAFVTAVERLCAATDGLQGALALLITSDEEGPAVDGTVRVVEWLAERGEELDWCLVGEPSSTANVGDVVRNGRRGSLNGHITIHGVQGHVAYPQLARNPIHDFVRVAAELDAEVWDEGNEFFPATSLQIANVNAGTGAENVIPGDLTAQFNFRYCTEVTREQLESRVNAILDKHDIQRTLTWRHSGGPFLTRPGALVEAVQAAVEAAGGYKAELSTGGGTSDGRFIAKTGAQIVELGPVNASIHRIDERVLVSELDQLSDIYESILNRLLT